LSEYVQAHEKLLRCWNCKEIINVTSCKDCSHEEPTKVCPYCGKCLHDNPKFVSGDLDHKVIKEQDGSWHIGFFLHVANCDGCEEKSYAVAEIESEYQEKIEATHKKTQELKALLREKKLVPNCSYNPDFYFCIGISGNQPDEIPESFKNCKGCSLGKFLFDLSLTKTIGLLENNPKEEEKKCST